MKGRLKIRRACISPTSAAIWPDSLRKRTQFGLFAAANPAEAKTKALNTLLPGHAQQHKDNLKDIGNLLALDRVGRHRIILTPNPHGRPSEIGFQGYLPI